MKQRHPYKRSERVADLLRQVVSDILMRRQQHRGLEDVTVTAAHLSDDLQHARVYYRVIHPDKKETVDRLLRQRVASIRRELAHELKLRYTPQLHFEYDASLEYGDRIETLLKSVKTERHGGEE